MKANELIRCALAAAILCVTAQLAIPLGNAPLTIQPFALALAGAVLGWKQGGIAAVVYVALGALGLPVFANFTGGAARLIGPTGGYLWTYPLLALGAGLGTGKVSRIVWALAGLLAMEFIGAWQLSASTGSPFWPYIAMFVPKDAVLVVLAVIPAEKIRRALKWQS